MTADDLLVVRRTATATWLGINRPGRRNALDRATSHALAAAVAAAEQDGPRVLVVHSTTPGTFVSGTDIGDLAQRSVEDAFVALNVRLFEQIARFRWPTIAVVDGPALGGGCELALACDLRVGSHAARFGQPEPRLGLVPGAGAHWRLPQLVGTGIARRMLLAGDVLAADEAYSAGLVDRLVDAGQLTAATHELIDQITARSWRALELTKLALRLHAGDTTSFDIAAQAVLYGSDDTASRLHAFRDRSAR